MKTIGVIPSRYASTRFPGKPLAVIKGQYLIERVWRQARKSKQLDEVVIATDDRRIADVARGFGAEVVMTSKSCACGTDRLAEVARKAKRSGDIFVNIQGDEPLIPPALIDALVLVLKRGRNTPAATAAYPTTDPAEINNHNVVKVVLDGEGYALYFSRSQVPFERAKTRVRYLKHMGIYAYRRKFLLAFSSWPQTPLEKTEQLEQLRVLERGYRMRVVIAKQDSFGVDVPSDIRKIERLLRSSK